MPVLQGRGHGGDRLARVRRRRQRAPPAPVRGVREALYHLRARRAVDADGGEDQRKPRSLRRREDPHRFYARAAQAAGAHRVCRAGNQPHRAAHSRARRARDPEPRDRRNGDARAEEDGRRRLHPLRFRVRGFSARGRLPRRDPRGEETRHQARAPYREVMFTAADHGFMEQALGLAGRGLNTTTPNPRVGCVIVKDGVLVGSGWHEKAGLPHAEVLALKEAGDRARGAALYVNLEPCSHHGRTPPCVDAIVASGIKRVVAAMQDPNPKVAGSGFAKLRTAGITVEHGLKEDEARELNIGFVSRMTRGRPWMRMKIAASLDGRTALANGKSQWITGEAARQDGHRWRARACAILTGFGTVRNDDPQLNVRGVDTPRQPLKIVVDSKFETSPSARLLKEGQTLVVGAVNDAKRIASLREAGAEVVIMPNEHSKVELFKLMEELARRELNEIHVEAGTKLNGSLLQAGVVDELPIYLAPSVIGDSGRGMFHLLEITELSLASALEIREVERIGADLRILARI